MWNSANVLSPARPLSNKAIFCCTSNWSSCIKYTMKKIEKIFLFGFSAEMSVFSNKNVWDFRFRDPVQEQKRFQQFEIFIVKINWDEQEDNLLGNTSKIHICQTKLLILKLLIFAILSSDKLYRGLVLIFWPKLQCIWK